MGIREQEHVPSNLALEEGCLKPLKNDDPENPAPKHEQGIWQKLRSSKVPLLYVSIGAAISVIVIIILIVLLSVRASPGNDKDHASLPKSTGETPGTEVIEVPIYVQCTDGWVLHRGICYYISNQSASWTDSQDFCKSHDSSLAIINNEKEMNFLNLLKANYWIGLSRTQDDSGWIWTDGTFYLETIFNIQRTPIEPDESECVFMNNDGFRSERGRYEKKWICSKRL